VEELGAGTVFRVALVSRAGDRVICKRLRPRIVEAHEAFEREQGALRLAAGLAEIPALVDAGCDEAGPWLLETAIEGTTLAALAERGPLPAALLASIAHASFAALARLHDRGLCHGDLAPDHVLVGKARGAIALIDFGMASWPAHPPSPAARGTLPYAPPEVARGEAVWSAACDVYALAATLAHAALGRPLVDAQGAALLAAVCERRLDLDGLDPHLLGALAFDPAERTSSAEVLARRFARC
jgi:eukaryotic-like serine/threonine-protein kinase